MSKRLRIFYVLALALSSIQLGAQDIHFSQFYMSPLNLNPALTGVMNCNTRFVANYRNQWAAVLKGAAYNTYSASFDQKMPVGRYDYFGYGADFVGDKAGTVDFATVAGNLSASYSKRLAGNRKQSHYLTFGAQAGFAQKSIDFIKAQWPSQNLNGEFAGIGSPTGEINLPEGNFSFIDLNGGLLWFSIFDEYTNVYGGFSFSHLNQANQSFYRENVFIPYYTKLTFHAGGQFQMVDRISLIPGLVIFKQGPSFELNGGASARFALGDSRMNNQSFQAGLWLRLANHFEDPVTTDAVILSTRFDYENFGIGFSYDINVSTLRAASNANGAFEFSMIYNICGPEKRAVFCPSF